MSRLWRDREGINADYTDSEDKVLSAMIIIALNGFNLL
jgi:hypothetical protein